MGIGKIASSAKYLMDEQFQNCRFFSEILVFQIETNSRNLLIFQFGQIQKFFILNILRISNLDNSKKFNLKPSKKCQFGKLKKNCRFGKCRFGNFRKFAIWKIQKILNLEILCQICKISKITNLENSRNLKFGKSKKFAVLKISKISDSENF